MKSAGLYFKRSIALWIGSVALSLQIQSQITSSNHYIKVRQPGGNSSIQIFQMGTPESPKGPVVQFNSQSMLQDGEPVLPVMGEFHYSRFPESDWKEELLKMRAGGIDIVASYIFWIHHEEIEGEYNWTGSRDLQRFVQVCRELDFPVILRVGPWCHGEVRNGGLPEWLVTSNIKLRENNSAYLNKLKTWYSQIYKQVEGEMWKDGGPVIGVQIENEYRGHGAHLLTIKEMIREIGFDVPLYTRTGWPKLASPVTFGEIIPLYGDYADGFWDRTLNEMPGDYNKVYLFRSFRNSTVIATEQLPQQSNTDNPDDVGYPYFTCELGGGMTPSYHRRINIAPMDIYAMALVRVGSGSNLPGYYMYHGGTNPDGKVTALNERQASNFTYHNDLPVKSYDFQAPLGEFGQINEHYHWLRRLHLFLRDFGSELITMVPNFPDDAPTDYNDNTTLRWSVRSNGQSGYVFVNNYHRLRTSSAKENVQFTIETIDKQFTFPTQPIDVPSNSSFFIPFNMQLGKANLLYSTAQPIAKLEEDNNLTYVFAGIKGIVPEFLFDSKSIKVEHSSVKPDPQEEGTYFRVTKPGTNIAIRLLDEDKKLINILVLDEKSSLNFWKGKLAGKERFFLSESGLTYHNNLLQLTDDMNDEFNVSIYPAPTPLTYDKRLLAGKHDGLFTRYEIKKPAQKKIIVKMEQEKEIGLPLRSIEMGKAKVAEMPSETDFDKAAVWKVEFSENMDTNRDLFLRIPYVGDVARVYLDDYLLTDNFYNGKSFEIGLKRYAPDIYEKPLYIKILPLQKDAPIYLQESAKPDFKNKNYAIDLFEIKVIDKQKITLEAR